MAATPDIVPELSELSKPYTLPASDPYRLQTQMGAGVPGVDTQKIDVKALGKLGSQERLQNIRQQEADLRQQELKSKERVAEGQQKIAELKSTGQAAITSQEAERAKGIYQSVEGFREKNPAPELTPTKENIQSLSTLFGLIGVIGMAMGGAGKQSATASLNAMGGMMKGWQQGRSDLWKKEVQEFDKNMLSWKSKLDDAMKKAEAAYKILPYNRAEAESKLNEILTSMGSSVLKEQNRLQGFEPTFKNLESLAKDADSAIKESGVERRHRETISQRRAEASKPTYQFYASGDKVIAVNTKNPSDIKEVTNKELASAIKLGAAPKEKGLPKKGESQAKFVGDAIGRPVDVDAASKLTSGLSYVQGLKELQEKNLTLGNVAGLSVAIADKVNGFLKPELDPLTRTQTIDITQEALDKAWTEAQKDKSFTSLSEKSKVMAKKELDTIMLNLQTKYGNRAPVAEFRAAQAVLSRRTSDPVAFNRTMQEETLGTYRRLNQLGFDKQDIEKMDNKLKQFESEAISSAPSLATQSDTDRVTGLPKVNSKGFILESDGQGTYLYINPKNRNEYEEPEL
jgi:hypothetical protein